jgi:hypothetical protein
MLVRHSPDQIDLTRTELNTLLERRLVSLDPRDGVRRPFSLTKAGRQLLDAIRHFDPASPRARDANDFGRAAAGFSVLA